MGRISLWLDPEDLRWLAARCCCGDDATEVERERCARLRFRASAIASGESFRSADLPSRAAQLPCIAGRRTVPCWRCQPKLAPR
jgi:hypothetical protein